MEPEILTGLRSYNARHFTEAADIFRRILEKDPDDANAIQFLGLSVWHNTQQLEEPMELFSRCLKLAPDRPQYHLNFAGILSAGGELKRAKDTYMRAIALNPAYTQAYYNLSQIYSFKTGDPIIKKMRALYAQGNLSKSDQEFLCYSLCKAANDTGQYDEAFQFALTGGRLHKKKYNPMHEEFLVGKLFELQNGETLAPRNSGGSDSHAPIFIVGMPRTGTTLVEHILSCHPNVFAAGERTTIKHINTCMLQLQHKQQNRKPTTLRLPVALAHVTDKMLNLAAQEYTASIHTLAKGRKYTRSTDKMPSNLRYIGLISQLFPNAKIIFMHRNPLDSCLSSFFTKFHLGHSYSNRLDTLGHYYQLNEQLKAHWKETIPLDILDVTYEELILNPKVELRRIATFAGLDWTDKFLTPEKANRAVLTASVWQVRQPMYKTSIGRWKRYEDWLDPLIEALGGRSCVEEYFT